MKYAVKAIKAEGNKAHEILVYGPIGKSWWSDEGISAKEFVDALNEVPRGEKVTIGVNSPGGAVGEGSAIYSAIARRTEDVTVRVDGYALSIASFFPLAASRVVTSRASIWMIHKAWNMAEGNADQFRKNADMLDVHDRTIVNAYIAKTGKSRKEVEDALSAETWMTGDEAVAWGLADEEGNHEVNIDASLDFAGAKFSADKAKSVLNKVFATHFQGYRDQVLGAWRLAASATQPTHTPMNQTPPADATTANTAPAAKTPQATPPTNADIAPNVAAELRTQIERLTAQNAAQNKRWIEKQVDDLLATRSTLDREDSIKRCLADESYLEIIAKWPQDQNQPVALGTVHNAGNPLIEDYRKIAHSTAIGASNPNGKPPRISAKAARERIAFRKAHGEELEANMARHIRLPLGANTISSTLKPDVLTDALITVANNKLAAWTRFSRLMRTDAMRPEATVQVKKATAGSTVQTDPTDWESGNSTLAPISVSLAQVTSSFHVSQGDRNYGFGLEDIAQVNADTYANALSDVVTAVMIAGNFGAAINVGAANGFDPDGLKPILEAAKNYRSKILLLDGGHIAYLAPSNRDGFRRGEEGQYGFDGFYEQNRWTGATANACGFVGSPDALAIAAGPPNNPESRAFDMVGTFTIADLDITVLYTLWFNTATRIQWASYELVVGCGAGDTTQGEVIVSA